MSTADIKIYSIAVGVTLFVLVGGLFFFKWYTKPLLDQYCGEFNEYTCNVGKCDYITNYDTGKVGYCRRTFLGF